METVFSYLKNRFGYDHVDRSFYRKIEEWNRWYTGTETSFHKTKVNNGLSVIEHDLCQMNMAKKVAEDWANLLMNEKTRIDTGDEKASEFLRGKSGRDGIFGKNDFWTGINQLVEQSFALGTGAVVLRLENALMDGNQRLLPSPNGKIRLEYVTAPNIIPLSWQGQRITEAAFVGSMTLDGQALTYLQIHRKGNDGYVIDSACFSDKTGKQIPLPEGICPTVHTKSNTPWFVIIKPNIVNNLTDMPMGISVYAGSIDILKSLDLCYDSFNMEFYLGKKMVFLRKDLMLQDQEGYLYAPQDCNRQLFMYIGDKNVDGDLLPQEFNPALRVSDHAQAIQQHLNYLSCKCGFGDRYYRFNGNFAPATATEVISSDAALYRTVRKHEILLERPLLELTQAILEIGETCLGVSMGKERSLSVHFDDSIIEDRTAEQKRDMELVSMGLMLDWEFRMKYYGETEDLAKERVRRIES